MNEQICPRCKTTKYRNPSLKLLVNACGHVLCENCVELLFVRCGGQCPECGVALKKNNYRIQFFEDSSIEKELEIRRKVTKDYNKKEDDFPTLRLYNNYLEDIEHMIFSLVNGDNAEETKRKITSYRKENKEDILRNRGKKSKDEEYIETLLEIEKSAESRWKDTQREERKLEEQRRIHKKEALIDDLMFSDQSASAIVSAHQSMKDTEPKVIQRPRSPPPSTFSSGIKMSQQSTSFVPMKIPTNPLYEYKEEPVSYCGPTPPADNVLDAYGFLEYIRESTGSDHAGGFTSAMACSRALQEAMCGLYLSFEDDLEIAPVISPSNSTRSDDDDDDEEDEDGDVDMS